MDFMGDYYSAMDRGYVSSVKKENPLSEIKISSIGISSKPFIDQVSALQARIFQGASTVELGFTGRGKGSMEGHNTTPEMYGQEEREAIRDMAKINKVNLSTHASYNIGTLSGMTQQGFDNGQRENTLREIERAIEFAADTAGGGAVVVHTGEFNRSLSESDWNKDQKFKMFRKEPEEAVMQLVDSQTGHVQSISKNMSFTMPKWKGENMSDWVKEEREEGLVGWPELDIDTSKLNEEGGKVEFKMKELNWKDLEKLTNWYNQVHRDDLRKEFAEAQVSRKPELTPQEVLIRLNTELQMHNSSAIIRSYEQRYNEAKKELDVLEPALRDLERGSLSRAEQFYLDRIGEEERLRYNSYTPQIREDILRRTLTHMATRDKSDINSFGPSIMAHQQQIVNMKNQFKRLMPVEDYAIEKTAETIARAAEFAHQKSEKLKKDDPRNYKSEIYVAPENIFPEQYGAHPQELKRIIQEARRAYVNEYKERYGEDKAKKLAEEHIKATLDIGHAYTWRKYYQEDPKKSFEENEKDFQKWLFKQIDDLNKDKLIGHIHVSDNFGWEDEHVTPGQGRVPIKDFIDRMKKAGIKDVITEPAHQDFKAMLGSWKEFGAPIYSTDGSARRWTEIEHSYFGQTRSPYFIFGDYAPSQQEFTLWSQVPLE